MKLVRDFLIRQARRNQSSNVLDVLRVQSMSAISRSGCHQSHSRRVSEVLFVGDVFKVVQPIVLGVAILVVNLAVVANTDKCFHHNSVNEHPLLSTVSVEADHAAQKSGLPINLPENGIHEVGGFKRLAWADPLNAAKATDVVVAFKANYRQPEFFHSSTSHADGT